MCFALITHSLGSHLFSCHSLGRKQRRASMASKAWRWRQSRREREVDEGRFNPWNSCLGWEKKLSLKVWKEKYDKMPLILIIPRFYSCTFAYVLKCICNLSIGAGDAFVVLCGWAQSGTSLSPMTCTLLAEVDESDTLPSSLSPCAVSRHLFHGLFCAIFFVPFVGHFPIWNTPRYSIVVLSSIPQCKKAMMCLMEKIHRSDKLLSAITYSAPNHEFSVDESTVYVK